jgi:hypothetical protein
MSCFTPVLDLWFGSAIVTLAEGIINRQCKLRRSDQLMTMMVYFQGSLVIKKIIAFSVSFPKIIDLSLLVAQLGTVGTDCRIL